MLGALSPPGSFDRPCWAHLLDCRCRYAFSVMPDGNTPVVESEKIESLVAVAKIHDPRSCPDGFPRSSRSRVAFRRSSIRRQSGERHGQIRDRLLDCEGASSS